MHCLKNGYSVVAYCSHCSKGAFCLVFYCNYILDLPKKQSGQSRDTHVVISQDLFTFCSRLKVCLTNIILF